MGVMTQPLVTGPAVPSQQAPASQPLRVRPAPAGVKPGRLDGARWPRSRDLAAELPSLVDALNPRWGRITVSVNSALWPETAFLTHLLNGRHAERISAFHFSTSLPVGVTARRDHRDGGRGRLRPRGNQTRSRRT